MTTVIAKVVSVLLTVYSLFVIAIVTGVVVSYYNQIIQLQQEETIAGFMEQLEKLPELSEEELKELSLKASYFRK